MQTGSWITVPADPMIVFEKDPAKIWADVLLGMGEGYCQYADMPFDPSFN
jgi:putative transcriptional regulator